MFEKLIEKIRLSFAAKPPFDPARFGDPLALRIEWTPARGGGANFRTHMLVASGTGRIEFRASAGAKLFYLVFLVIGLGVIIAFTAAQLAVGALALRIETLFPILFGLVFAGVGGAMYYFGTMPVVFDKVRGFYWKGHRPPYELADPAARKQATRLEQIHALQLLSEYCRGKNNSYYSYELNLVLKDGRRLNVIDHGNLGKLRADAAALARFLGKPVWDAI